MSEAMKLLQREAVQYGMRMLVRSDTLAQGIDTLGDSLFASEQAFMVLRGFLRGEPLNALLKCSRGDIALSDPIFPVTRTVLNSLPIGSRRDLVIACSTQLQELSAALFRSGNYDAGESIINDVLDSLQESGRVLVSGPEQEELASALALCSDFEVAERVARRVSHALENNNQPLHRSDAMMQRALGEVLRNREDYEASGAAFAQADGYLRSLAVQSSGDGHEDDWSRRD